MKPRRPLIVSMALNRHIYLSLDQICLDDALSTLNVFLRSQRILACKAEGKDVGISLNTRLAPTIAYLRAENTRRFGFLFFQPRSINGRNTNSMSRGPATLSGSKVQNAAEDDSPCISDRIPATIVDLLDDEDKRVVWSLRLLQTGQSGNHIQITSRPRASPSDDPDESQRIVYICTKKVFEGKLMYKDILGVYKSSETANIAIQKTFIAEYSKNERLMCVHMWLVLTS